jgi:hypothetical protein
MSVETALEGVDDSVLEVHKRAVFFHISMMYIVVPRFFRVSCRIADGRDGVRRG